MQYGRILSVFLISATLLPSCSHSEKGTEPRTSRISPADDAEFDSLVAAAKGVRSICENWRVSVNEIQEEISSLNPDSPLRPETYSAAIRGLETYPGIPNELTNLMKFFREAGTRPGFPADYDWDWMDVLPEMRGCAEIHWFSLAKNTVSRAQAKDRNRLRVLLFKQMDQMMANEPRLVTLLIALATTRQMAESKLIRLSAKDTRRLDWIDTEARKLKAESIARTKSIEAEDEYWACADQMGRGEKIETQGKCDREQVVQISKIAGQLMSEELNRTYTLAEALRGWFKSRKRTL